jgi:hypothetical protein
VLAVGVGGLRATVPPAARIAGSPGRRRAARSERLSIRTGSGGHGTTRTAGRACGAAATRDETAHLVQCGMFTGVHRRGMTATDGSGLLWVRITGIGPGLLRVRITGMGPGLGRRGVTAIDVAGLLRRAVATTCAAGLLRARVAAVDVTGLLRRGMTATGIPRVAGTGLSDLGIAGTPTTAGLPCAAVATGCETAGRRAARNRGAGRGTAGDRTAREGNAGNRTRWRRTRRNGGRTAGPGLAGADLAGETRSLPLVPSGPARGRNRANRHRRGLSRRRPGSPTAAGSRALPRTDRRRASRTRRNHTRLSRTRRNRAWWNRAWWNRARGNRARGNRARGNRARGNRT